MQHFRAKVFATTQPAQLHGAIAVFHRWIQDRSRPESLIDVSDYLHVPMGPGVILVAQEAIYSLDQEKGRLGLMYNRRVGSDGTIEDRLRQAVEAARSAAAQLEREPEFAGKLAFDYGNWEISVNDRALAPNTDETWKKLQPAVAAVFGPDFRLEWVSEPKELMRISARRS